MIRNGIDDTAGDPTERFSDRVENYVRFRPSYPRGLIDELVAADLLAPGSSVADVGSGTGKLAELFLEHGNRVFGVEPNREMREAGARLLEDRPMFISVDGRAEETTLPSSSVDLVVAGQAFHWFDREPARREFTRILRPGGACALVWNDRVDDANPFMADYEAFLRTHGTDYSRVDHKRIDDREIAEFYGGPGPTTQRFDNGQVLDFDGLLGRVLSCSYVPDESEPGYPSMLADLERLFARHHSAGSLSIVYRTRLIHGRLGGGASGDA